MSLMHEAKRVEHSQDLIPDDHVIVLCGATGDLARRKLLPGLFHLSEAGLLPNSDFLHVATEKFSPDGLYGKWFSPIMIGICGLWLLGAWLIDRRANKTENIRPQISQITQTTSV